MAAASRPQKRSAWIRSSRATGSSESAPARRASSTWRAVSSSQATSSPSARAMWQASHEPAQLLLLGERRVPERAQRLLQRRRPRGVALA